MMDDANALAAEHETLLQFLYLAPVGLLQLDMAGAIELINPLSAQLLLPISKDGSLYNLFDALEPVAPELRNMVCDYTKEKGTICESFRIYLTSGVPGEQEPKILGLSLIKLNPNRLMAVLTDMTQVVAQEKQLRYNKAWFNAVTTGVTDYALISLDQKGVISSWNPSVRRVTQFSENEIVGRSFSVLYPPGGISQERCLDYLREADENGWSLDEGWRIKADGERFWGSSMIAPIQDLASDSGLRALESHEKNYGYVLILRDINDQQVGADAFLRSLMSDHLTGISNRRAFFEAADLELKRWYRHPRPLSLLMIDADHFKRINDTYGHASGDLVLRNLALILKESMRDIDTVARIGGEEFVAMLPSTGLEGALALAERFRSMIEAQCLTIDGAEIQYTVSIGISMMNESVLGVDDFLQRTDKALYEAKNAGRNQIKIAAESQVSLTQKNVAK